MLQKPEIGEYPAFYETYVSKVQGADVWASLEDGLKKMLAFLNSIDEEKANYAYAPGKWTIKEVLGHLIDSERIFAYRALCFARKEKQALPGYDENEYVAEANFQKRTIASLILEYELLRKSSIASFRGLDEATYLQSGIANGKEITVRALIAIIAGHELHHLQVIKERYF